MPTFDPDAAAAPGTGIFGLPFEREECAVVLLPVPFDATTSYSRGTANGPAAIFDASMQVDLFDRRFGRIYEKGIFMEEEDGTIAKLNAAACESADPIIAAAGAENMDDAGVAKELLSEVAAACEQVNEFTYKHTKAVLAQGKVPGLIGGDHSTPFGAIKACAEYASAGGGGGLGILHLDAHMDLRDAFEGFAWSHASIMHNVMSRIGQVGALVQVGIRDFGERELMFARQRGVKVFFADDIEERLLEGDKFSTIVQEIINALPDKVYISVDIDALDPWQCPTTGTPVPGGLTFNQAALILEALKKSGKKVIGFDLVEVAPAENGEWDANVGARMLYKLCGTVA
jgi:agmatinase